MSPRGSILLQALLLAAVVSLLCASLLRARLAPALAAARDVDRAKQDLAEQGALNRVGEAWLLGGACSSSAALGVSCAGEGCACACSVEEGISVVSAPRAAGEGACALRASSPSDTSPSAP